MSSFIKGQVNCAPAADAATLLRQQIAPKFRIVSLESNDLLNAFEEADARGVRGGAIYDYLHLVAARKAGADRLFTLKPRDFLSFHRPRRPGNSVALKHTTRRDTRSVRFCMGGSLAPKQAPG